LKEATAQGAITGINKEMTLILLLQSVTDPLMGTTAVRPMIHVRHRAYGSMNRDYELVVRDWKDGNSLTDILLLLSSSEQAVVLIGRNNTIV
jgi:hypothetical protein